MLQMVETGDLKKKKMNSIRRLYNSDMVREPRSKACDFGFLWWRLKANGGKGEETLCSSTWA